MIYEASVFKRLQKLSQRPLEIDKSIQRTPKISGNFRRLSIFGSLCVGFLIFLQSRSQGLHSFWSVPNLVPRVLRLFGQRLVARRDSGELLATNRWPKSLRTCGLDPLVNNERARALGRKLVSKYPYPCDPTHFLVFYRFKALRSIFKATVLIQ